MIGLGLRDISTSRSTGHDFNIPEHWTLHHWPGITGHEEKTLCLGSPDKERQIELPRINGHYTMRQGRMDLWIDGLMATPARRALPAGAGAEAEAGKRRQQIFWQAWNPLLGMDGIIFQAGMGVSQPTWRPTPTFTTLQRLDSGHLRLPFIVSYLIGR